MTLYAADANAGQVAYEEEIYYGTTPSPFNAQKMPITSSSLNPNKNTTRSNMIRADGMGGPLVETSFTSNGELPTEVMLGGTFDELFQATLRGIWSSGGAEIIRFRGDVTFTNATSNVNATGAFASAVVGARFHVAECNNAGDYTITTVTDDDNVVVTETVADETTSTGEVTIVGYEPMAIDATGALAVVAATQTFTLTNAFTNAQPEQAFFVGNMVNSGNNGWHVIQTVTDASNVVVYTPVADLTDETGPGTAFCKGVGVRNGTVKRSFSIEQYQSDRDVNFLFKGQRFGSFNLSLNSGEIATITFASQGGTVVAASGETAGTKVDYPTVEPVNATANVGKFRINNAAADCLLKDLTINLDDALRDQMAVGSKYPCNIGYGRQTVGGSATIYFQDLTYYNLMLNHTGVALETAMTDSSGNGLHIYIPQFRIASDTAAQLPGIDTDVEEAIDFEAEAHSEGFQIQITAYTV